MLFNFLGAAIDGDLKTNTTKKDINIESIKPSETIWLKIGLFTVIVGVVAVYIHSYEKLNWSSCG